MQTMISWLGEAIADSRSRQQTLRQEYRQDEAVFEKVQENVYDIFRTVLSVALRQHGDSAEARAFFDLRLEQIPAAWLSSLQQALRHGDDRKAHTEQLKLQALAAVKAAWQGVQEE